jgi:DNA replication and repair protein RecF
VRLTRLELTEFRLYHQLDLTMPTEGLLLIGRNASGKSTILEAIRMLSMLRSPRSTHDRDVIHWESGSELDVAPYARLVGHAQSADGVVVVEVGLQRPDDGIGPLRKQIKINQQSRRMQDSIGILKSVLFTPEDLDLVSGPPGGRRRFMDLVISQLDRGYVLHLARYFKVVEQRNSLLRSNARTGGPRNSIIEQLGFWDQQLIEHGAYVIAARRELLLSLCVAFFNRTSLFTETAQLTTEYAPNLGQDFLAAARAGDSREQIEAVAQRELEAQIRMRRDEELRRGVTVVGPHRDDLIMYLDQRPLAEFGSRGQQRLAVIALKLAEADVIESVGERPVLLLDDVLSELDSSHRDALLRAVVASGAQVVITTADGDQVSGTPIANLARAEVFAGSISISE